MYLIITINQNLLLCDHENKKLITKLNFHSISNKLSKFKFLNKLCHFTINILIYIKFSSCYTSEFIPYTYFKYNYTIINVNIFLSGYLGEKKMRKKKLDRVNLNNYFPPPSIRCH